MICPTCTKEVNPYQEMMVNGSFMMRCPRQECYATIPSTPGAKEAQAKPGPIDSKTKTAKLVSLPGRPEPVADILQQLQQRKEWLTSRIDELKSCEQELEIVSRMLSASDTEKSKS